MVRGLSTPGTRAFALYRSHGTLSPNTLPTALVLHIHADVLGECAGGGPFCENVSAIGLHATVHMMAQLQALLIRREILRLDRIERGRVVLESAAANTTKGTSARNGEMLRADL